MGNCGTKKPYDVKDELNKLFQHNNTITYSKSRDVGTRY